MAAAARMSSIRPLVQLPMNTTSIFRSAASGPASGAMYSSMRCIWARCASSAAAAGSGTTPVIGSTASGLVPQVTIGAMSAASSVTTLS